MRRTQPQDIVDFKDQLAGMALAMSGQFDAAIIEMKQAKADLEAAQLIQRTLAEAEEIKHAAVQFAATARGEVEGIEARAEEHRLDVLSHIAEAKAVLSRAEQEKDITASGWIELERAKSLFEKNRASLEGELKRRLEMVTEREAGIDAEYEKLRVQQAKLVSRLKTLETVA